MNVGVIVAAIVAIAITLPRWLRVAQREHYLAISTTRFAWRWWCRTGIANLALVAAASAGFVGVWWLPALGLACAAAEILGPIGLSPRGRTSALVWTRRLRTTTASVVVIDAAVIVSGVVVGHGAAVASCTATMQPVVIDIALAISAPFERLALKKYVRRAETRLHNVAPLTIAVTGSFGKTTTKLYARHLIGGSKATVVSPASFNNTGGLARTVNEHLVEGTEVFVAEMGTYGRGEIASMCEWVRPTVGAVVNIGPVHLERMKSLDAIVAAKAEIVQNVDTAVINVDAYGLTAVADAAERQGKHVIRFSTRDRAADVAVIDREVLVAGAPIATLPSDATPTNVAAAVAVALAAGVPSPEIATRLPNLPRPEHRRAVTTAASGAVVIDNTFSSNPASVEVSLGALDAHRTPAGRAVVVTPGLVELGRAQVAANEAMGRAVATTATDAVVVGLTNRPALDRGLRGGKAAVHHARTRDDAVAWVRANLGVGDVVLYENDLPDHYP